MNDIFWVMGEPQAPLAVVLKPRGGDELEQDLRRMKQSGIDTLVSLLETHEAEWLELGDEPRLAEETGLEFLSFPIPDTRIPANPRAFRGFVEELAARLRAGERVGVHCRGSVGRATITAACTLIHLGWNPRNALVAIEKARGCVVPDTPEQKAWILAYEVRP